MTDPFFIRSGIRRHTECGGNNFSSKGLPCTKYFLRIDLLRICRPTTSGLQKENFNFMQIRSGCTTKNVCKKSDIKNNMYGQMFLFAFRALCIYTR